MEALEQPDEVFYADARNLFIHEVILNRRGTCANLPIVYVAIGRRLGYPLHLVPANRHLFVRWDEPGERFNIEITTSGGMNTYPDEHYLRWPIETTLEEVGVYGFLMSMNHRKELVKCLANRATCWLENRNYRQAADTYAWVNELLPDDPGYYPGLAVTLKRWRKKLDQEAGTFMPPIILETSKRWFPAMPKEVENQMLYFNASERLLQHPEFEARWWGPARQNPKVRPPGFPGHIVLRYPERAQDPVLVKFSQEPLPPGLRPVNPKTQRGDQHV